MALSCTSGPLLLYACTMVSTRPFFLGVIQRYGASGTRASSSGCIGGRPSDMVVPSMCCRGRCSSYMPSVDRCGIDLISVLSSYFTSFSATSSTAASSTAFLSADPLTTHNL